MAGSQDESGNIDRRNFLRGVTLTGAAALTAPVMPAAAQTTADNTAANRTPPLPNLQAETQPPTADPVVQTSSGGDFMADVLKALDIDYLAMNCASSFRGLHEAIINHTNNKPEILTCPHEEIAVSMAQGYAKIEGKPMAMICHGTVGLQHATMALYNAWCDRVPVYVMIGNIVEADKRAPGAEWVHSAIDPAALVRDFVKWDDQPASLQHFAESAVRAYKIAHDAADGAGAAVARRRAAGKPDPRPQRVAHPEAFARRPAQWPMAGAIAEAARMLAKAEHPVIVCDRLARTPAGMQALVELAETLQCAVIDNGGRLNFPSRHPLNQTLARAAVLAQADVILAIEMNDLWGTLNVFATASSARRSRSTRTARRSSRSVAATST